MATWKWRGWGDRSTVQLHLDEVNAGMFKLIYSIYAPGVILTGTYTKQNSTIVLHSTSYQHQVQQRATGPRNSQNMTLSSANKVVPADVPHSMRNIVLTTRNADASDVSNGIDGAIVWASDSRLPAPHAFMEVWPRNDTKAQFSSAIMCEVPSDDLQCLGRLGKLAAMGISTEI